MKYDELLTPYISADQKHPGITKARTIGAFTYATNGFALIRIPNHMLEHEHGAEVAEFPPPDFEMVITKGFTHRLTVPMEIDCEALNEWMQAAPRDKVHAPCDRCDFGHVHCQACGYSHECRTCDGSGTSEEVISTHIRPQYVVKTGQVYLPARWMEVVLNTKSLLLHPLLRLTDNEKYHPTLFQVGEVLLAVSPVPDPLTGDPDIDGPRVYNCNLSDYVEEHG